MWEVTSQGLHQKSLQEKRSGVLSLSHMYQMPVSSQHSVRCLCLFVWTGCVSCQIPPCKRLWKLKLRHSGPGASPPLTRAPHSRLSPGHLETQQHTPGLWAGSHPDCSCASACSWFVGWWLPWRRLGHFSCFGWHHRTCSFFFFFFFTSFQTHTHNFCQPGCTLSPSLHVFAMSQKLIISSATACNLCTGRKQKATGKPEDLHEAWNKPLQTAYTSHRNDLKLTSREKNALKSVRGKTAYP